MKAFNETHISVLLIMIICKILLFLIILLLFWKLKSTMCVIEALKVVHYKCTSICILLQVYINI